MRRMGAIVLAVVLVIPAAAAAAQSGLPDHAAEKVAAAHAQAAEAAQEHAGEKARGQNPDKTTGLARAAEVSKSWKFTGEAKPGNGNALGQGRSDAVHEALASGVSPSTLDKHGESVSAAAKEMAAAFKAMKAKPEGHPGQGQGKGLGGPGGDDGDDG